MKTLFIMLITLTYCMGISAVRVNNDYIVANDEKTTCKKVNVKKNEVRVICENGMEKIIKKSDVTEFSKKGKTFVKLSVYKNQQLTDHTAFMELIRDVNGYKLYRTTIWTNEIPARNIDCFYVFNKDKFLFHTNEYDIPRTLKFFNIKFIEL